jgi:hypothetical membrane protein
MKNLPCSGRAGTVFFLRLGSAIPAVFFLATMVCGCILGDCNHLTGLVSELGVLGTPTHYIFSAGLLLCSALSVLFVIGLCGACRTMGISTVPVFMILSYSLSIAGAGIFPLPLRLHRIMGMPSVLLILSPLSSLLLWGKIRHPWRMNAMAFLSFLIMSLGFLALMPDILGRYPGLKQRFFHLG